MTMSDERFDELAEWDIGYQGELLELDRDGLVERLSFDAGLAQDEASAAGLHAMAETIEALDAKTPLGFFCWAVGDLGPLRRCLVQPAKP